MSVIRKTVLPFVCTALGLIGLYTGVSFAAALHRAVNQPHLETGAGRIDFLGYYMIAAINGVICASALILLTFCLLRKIRKKKGSV